MLRQALKPKLPQVRETRLNGVASGQAIAHLPRFLGLILDVSVCVCGCVAQKPPGEQLR